jgi:DNA-binding MarR family transcriptional regulator
VYEESVGWQLKRAQHALRLVMDKGLGEIGLSTPQYAALTALARYPSASSADLARLCFVTPQTMTGIVRGLAAARLTRRQGKPQGRARALELTDQGRRLLAKADRLVSEAEQKMLVEIRAEDRARLRTLLASCGDALLDGDDEAE